MKKRGGLSLPAIILIIFSVIVIILLSYFLYPSIINLIGKNSINNVPNSETNNKDNIINPIGTNNCSPIINPCDSQQCGRAYNGTCGTVNCGGCNSTDSCINGVCVSPNCVPNSNQTTCGTATCGNITNNCGTWISCGSCSSDKTCQSGSCVTLCTNDCSTTGLKQCYGSGYQTCGNYDTESCLEWGSVTSCPIEQICQQGSCVVQNLSNKWAFVLANNGIPMSENSVNFFCNSVKSNISAWLKRESDKYNQAEKFPEIECLADQIILPEELISRGIGVSGNVDLETVSFLESKYPSLEDATFVTVITYLKEGPGGINHMLNIHYNFVYATGTTFENYYLLNYYDIEVSEFSRTIAHEYMHSLGALDKYSDSPTTACQINPLTGQDYDGYDIMCHRILKDGFFSMPPFSDLIVSEPTAKEISWLP